MKNQTVIEPKKGWQLINWKELIEYKDLFFFLILRDIKVIDKQTILGLLWPSSDLFSVCLYFPSFLES